MNGRESRAAHDGVTDPIPTPRGTTKERRRHPRMTFLQFARLETSATRCLADLINMSSSGALVQAPRALLPREASVRIILIDGTQLNCSVVWSDNGAAGLRFKHHIVDPAEHLDPEYLGSNFFVRVMLLQRQLSQKRIGWTDV